MKTLERIQDNMFRASYEDRLQAAKEFVEKRPSLLMLYLPCAFSILKAEYNAGNKYFHAYNFGAKTPDYISCRISLDEWTTCGEMLLRAIDCRHYTQAIACSFLKDCCVELIKKGY